MPNSESMRKDSNQLICFKCGGQDHFVSICPNKILSCEESEQESQNHQEDTYGTLDLVVEDGLVAPVMVKTGPTQIVENEL